MSGLEEGEEVITGPHRILKALENGDAVKPEKDEKKDKKKGKDKDESSDDKDKDEDDKDE